MEETGEDDVIAASLAVGKTWEEAAAVAGVSRSTVARRCADPGFRVKVSDIRRGIVERAVGLMTNSLADAITQLSLISQDGEIERNRLRASMALADLLRKFAGDIDLSERMRRLEEKLGITTVPPSAGGTDGG